jgi:hypothetical protein
VHGHFLKKSSGLLSLLSVVGIAFALYRIIPLGMSGSIGQATAYIVLAIVSLVVGIPAAVSYQSQHNEAKTDPELEKMRMEIEMIAQSGHKKK